jgi:predicted DNA-binding antitoxin AbrB/MazE fold protein
MEPFTVEAVYENGVLKPAQPLPLLEQEQVQVTVQRAGSAIPGCEHPRLSLRSASDPWPSV